MIIRKLDFIQFTFCVFQIFKNICTSSAILTAQSVYDIQTGFNIFQFLRRIGETVPGIPDSIRRILHLIH